MTLGYKGAMWWELCCHERKPLLGFELTVLSTCHPVTWFSGNLKNHKGHGDVSKRMGFSVISLGAQLLSVFESSLSVSGWWLFGVNGLLAPKKRAFTIWLRSWSDSK